MERQLMTSGKTLTLWDVNDGYKQLYEYCPSEGNISGNCWSPDGSCIASSLTDSHKIVMTYSKNKVLTSAEISSLSSTPLKAICFPKTCQKFLYLGSENCIRQLEISKAKIIKEYKWNDSEVLNCLTVSAKDGYLALGTQEGGLKLINSVSSVLTHLPNSSESQAITQLRYNNVKTSMIGSSSDSGMVTFWDTNSGKKIQCFKQHTAPSLGLAFSPVNEMLVLSAGLDKRCICYDTKEKKPVSTIKTDFPLTCVDFHPEGFILGLGTSKGKILLYDLRSYTSPMRVISGYETTVHSLLFSPRKSDPYFTRLNRKAPLRNQVLKENIPSPVLKNDDSLGGTQVFSPLRNEFTSSPVPSEFSLGNVSHNLSSESLFSPLRENSLNRTPLTSFDQSSAHGTPVFSPLYAIHEENVEKSQISSLQRNDESYFFKEITSKPEIIKENPSSPHMELKTVITAFPTAVTSSNNNISSPSQEHSFPQNFTHNTIKEAMEEFTFDMRKQLWRIQYDNIRSSQAMIDEIKSTMEHYTNYNNQLQQANVALLMENEQLKKYI